MREINLAMLMKLAWSFLTGKDELGKSLRFKYLDKNGDIIKSYKKSMIWPGIKEGLKEIKEIAVADFLWLPSEFLERQLGSYDLNKGSHKHSGFTIGGLHHAAQ